MGTRCYQYQTEKLFPFLCISIPKYGMTLAKVKLFTMTHKTEKVNAGRFWANCIFVYKSV